MRGSAPRSAARALPFARALPLALAACDSAAPLVRDFGDGYVVEGDPPPATVGDELRVTISHGGGCAEHTFALHSRMDSGTADVWLEHDAGGDRCFALLTADVRQGLPERVLAAPVIRLPRPETDPIPLRSR